MVCIYTVVEKYSFRVLFKGVKDLELTKREIKKDKGDWDWNERERQGENTNCFKIYIYNISLLCSKKLSRICGCCFDILNIF